MFRIILLGIALVLLGGCAASVGPGSRSWSESEEDIVWPSPPEAPRIKYLRAVSAHQAENVADQKGGQWFSWLTGEDQRQMPLLAPYSVVADGSGRMWVADTQGKSLVVFDLARNKVTRNNVFKGLALEAPVGLAIDSKRGRLYLSDSKLARVFVCNLSGELIKLLDYDGFVRPAGMAIDPSGSLLVADVSRGDVLKFSPDLTYVRSYGSRLTDDGRFNRPSNIAVGEDGVLYVVDSLNFRVELISSSGEGLGSIGTIGDVPGSFARPRGVALDSEGHLYVADAAFGNIQVFNREGQLLLYFGESGKEVGQFSLPAGLFFDPDDRLYVVDSYNHRIQLFQYLPQHVEP